jgi:hypothetical protein
MNKIIVLRATIFILLCGIASSFGQTVSEEAKRHSDRGMAAVEMAKTAEDYGSAIKEFEQAAKLAPDWPDVYYNLGMVQEKAGKYSDAVTNLQQYLRLAPNASDAETVKSLINKLEYKKEQFLSVSEVIDVLVSLGNDAKLPLVNQEWKESSHADWLDWRFGPSAIGPRAITREGDDLVKVWRVEEWQADGAPLSDVKYQTVKVRGRILRYTVTECARGGLGTDVKNEVEVVSKTYIKFTQTVIRQGPWGESAHWREGQSVSGEWRKNASMK